MEVEYLGNERVLIKKCAFSTVFQVFAKKVRFFKKIQDWIFLKKGALKSYEFS